MRNGTREIRKHVYDYFCETASAPVVEDIAARFELTRRETVEILKELESERHIAFVPGTVRILMAHPFSAIATPFRVRTAAGVDYFANCSWDAISLHVLLEEDVHIESFCHESGERISIELSSDRVVSAEPLDTLVYIGLPAARWWDNVVHTCSNTMLYFGSHAHRDRWLSTEGIETPGESLTIEQAIGLGIPIFRGKLELDYERPSPAELRRTFESMGLGGPFWEI